VFEAFSFYKLLVLWINSFNLSLHLSKPPPKLTNRTQFLFQLQTENTYTNSSANKTLKLKTNTKLQQQKHTHKNIIALAKVTKLTAWTFLFPSFIAAASENSRRRLR